MDAGSLGPHVQAKSTATFSDLQCMYTGRVKKSFSQLFLDEQSDCDEAIDMSGDNQTWHSAESNMPSRMLSFFNDKLSERKVTKEKSSVQNVNTAVNKVEESNPKKVDYIR